MDFGILIVLALALPVCAFAGFFMALGQRRRSREFALQLAAFGARLHALEASFVAPAAGPSPFPEPKRTEGGPPTVPAPEAEPPRGEPPAGEAFAAPSAEPAGETRSGPDLEAALGTRWAVWVGGVALALGGLFLVRYSIEQGVFGPSVRIAAGTLFSAVLLAAGEWMRRREIAASIPGIRSAHIPGVLTAAGTSTAFATIYAAYALYAMLPPAAAFVLLGAVAVVTMLASALHGPGLAALGLVAAFASPLLVTTSEPNPWALVLYLGFIVVASYGVARLRLWRWLAQAAAAGAILWTFPLLVAPAPPSGSALLVHVLLQAFLAGIFLVADPARRMEAREAQPDRFANLVLLAFALLGTLATFTDTPGRLASAGALAMILLGFAVRYPAASPSAVWAAIVTTGTLMAWPLGSPAAPDGSGPAADDARQIYLAFAVFLPAIIAGASLWRIARIGALSFRPAAWLCAAATLAPLSALVAAYWRIDHPERSFAFAIVGGLLGLGFVAVAAWLRRDERDETIRLAVGATASAAIAALAAGLTFVLEQGMLTVAFALAAVGTAWVADRAAISALRYAVGAIALVVLARLLWDPTIVRGPAGDTPLFNWFLWGYGVPALAFHAASRIMERAGRDQLVRLLESLSILLGALLAFFQIRHWIHGGDVFAASSGHLEAGLLATTALAFSVVLVRMNTRRPDLVYRVGSLAFGAVSLLICAVGLGIVHNPLFTAEAVPGGPIFNSLLPSYLLPAILAAVLAMFARASRPRWYVLSSIGVALVLHLLYTILAIRRAFQGPVIGINQITGQAELWTYSAALLLIGVAILAIGLGWRIRTARIVSAGYLMAAVLKVFVIDLANLEGIARAMSFIGLGLALVAIGLVYQRLSSARTRPAGG